MSYLQLGKQTFKFYLYSNNVYKALLNLSPEITKVLRFGKIQMYCFPINAITFRDLLHREGKDLSYIGPY